MELHAYDLFMIVVILTATLFGAWKGMAWQIASLGSLVASYFISLRFSDALAPHLGPDAPWNKFLAMLVLYLCSSASIWLIFQMVSKLIERVKLQEFDQQVGALFGAFKGAVLCVAITFFCVSLSKQARDTILNTRSGYLAAVAMQKAEGVMPPEMLKVIDPYLQRFEQIRQAGPTATAAQTGVTPNVPTYGHAEGFKNLFEDNLEKVDDQRRAVQNVANQWQDEAPQTQLR